MALRTTDDPFPADAVTVHEAASLVRVSAKTISRRMWQGHLRCWRDKVSGRIRLSRADVLALWEFTAADKGPRLEIVPPRQRAGRSACGLPRNLLRPVGEAPKLSCRVTSPNYERRR